MKAISRDAAFAMEFADDTTPLTRNVVAVSWTVDALRVLKQIRDEATTRAQEEDEEAFLHLPYAHLRAQLHLQIDAWVGIDDDIGLRSLYVPSNSAAAPEAWGYLVSADARADLQKIKDAFATWSEGVLARYCESRGAYAPGVAALRRLGQEDRIVRTTPSRVQIFPWGRMPQAKSGTPTPFDVTAGVLAAHLAGQELFPGLGPVVRVVGGPEHNSAEVMTRPHMAAGGRFSLVCELSVQTLPGSTKPLIYCEFKRRRWADGLKSGYTVSSSIRGFVLPHAMRPQSAYRFSVMRQRAGKWITDLGYQQYEYAFNLVPGHENEGVFTYPSEEAASVLVMLKPEVTEQHHSKLQAGVPLVDQADAFERISAVLGELGLRPFTDFSTAKAVTVKAPPLAMLKAEVTLGRLLDRHEHDDDEAPPGKALEAITSVSPDRWFKADVPAPDAERDRVVAAVRTLTADTAYIADTSRHQLYVVTQTPEDVEWIKTTAAAMLGDVIKVLSVPLPANTHGPMQNFTEGRRKQRFDARVREWLKFGESLKLGPRSMVLVQAPMFYKVEGDKFKPDDNVNKLAARKALGSLGCTVQYLLPSEHGRVDKFLPRVQAALLDLVFGHAGSVWGLKQAGEACFTGSVSPPRWVGAVSSLVVQSEWFRDRAQSVFVATRMDCETGQAWVRFAHQTAEIVQTDWMRFDEGAKYLASTRMELPAPWAAKRELLAQFFQSTFDDMVAVDPNAVVFIDSTRAARLASWLSDSGMRETSRQVAPGVLTAQRWPTLRLIRIREQAPTIGQEKIFGVSNGAEAPLRTWTSTPRLFRVSGASAPTFWSLARPGTHHKRGASCYREMLLPNSNQTEDNPKAFVPFPAQPDKQHLNSRAVEVVILQKQADDDEVQLASFAQHLRAGLLTARNERWVTAPTPLRIIDKLTEYMRGG
ncbi:RNaseH domain-containing protein [Melaminivora sp.]|uniref:RNaseH domain-containing protein n=1 Tax=Melaminivora sp. TaxID=1933032 RepID=UPI0028A680D5|nr:RNaseH domain-containing protein [Melaminivora sp.]